MQILIISQIERNLSFNESFKNWHGLRADKIDIVIQSINILRVYKVRIILDVSFKIGITKNIFCPCTQYMW